MSDDDKRPKLSVVGGDTERFRLIEAAIEERRRKLNHSPPLEWEQRLIDMNKSYEAGRVDERHRVLAIVRDIIGVLPVEPPNGHVSAKGAMRTLLGVIEGGE